MPLSLVSLSFVIRLLPILPFIQRFLHSIVSIYHLLIPLLRRIECLSSIC